MSAILCLALMIAGVEMKSVIQESAQTIEKRSSACYALVGCFTTDPPFSTAERLLSVLPESPDTVQTKFDLYSPESPATPQSLDARHPETVATAWTHFGKRPTQFIVHGFLNNPSSTDWPRVMKDELLKHGSYNVIVVDWSQGNKPPYTMATANTRVVGAQIAVLIKELIKTKGVTAASFHIIGHSLGAHVAGYAGERLSGLGRITGLDPAGPYFQNTDKTVRLDPSDAVFVDVIHTDAESLLHLGFGIKEQVGHADYYPNLGHDQPGCTRSPIAQISENGLMQGLKEVVACNHLRSIKFFTESINVHCPYVAFPCASEDDFAKNKCHACTGSGCATMGFNAKILNPNQVKYFLTTAAHDPFCEFHLDLTIKLTSGKGTEERGTFQVVIHGTKGSTAPIQVIDSGSPVIFKPGTSYQYYLGNPSDIGAVQSISFTWDHDSSILNPSQWNILGLRHPTLFLDEVDVISQESNTNVRFCSRGQGVETDKTFTISTRC